MILGLALLAAIVAGGLVGMLVIKDPGYVMINYGELVMETSLWVAVLMLVCIYLVYRVLIFTLRVLLRGQGTVLNWRSGRKTRLARKQTVQGLLLMAEGRWGEAKKVFLLGVNHVETPLINYLNAARAAHEMGQGQERDSFLKRAHETTPGAKFAALLTQAEFQMEDGRYEQALAALISLSKRAPKHKSVLAMLAACYEALGDWSALHAHLKAIADLKAVSAAELKRLSKLVWLSLFKTDQDVSSMWKKLPKSLKEESELLTGWVDTLHQRTLDDEAELLMRLILDDIWIESVVARYGKIYATDSARQQIVAQSWAKSRPSDPVLALALGRLCLKNELFEQAREHLENALRLKPNDEVYAELGRLCIALGDEHRGTDYLLRSVGSLPDLPLPSTTTVRSFS